MADNKKCSLSTDSKQNEFEEQGVIDVKDYVQRKLAELRLEPDSTNEDKFVLFYILSK